MSVNDIYNLLPLPYDYFWIYLLPFPYAEMFLIGLAWAVFGYVGYQSWKVNPSRLILALAVFSILLSIVGTMNVKFQNWLYWPFFLVCISVIGLMLVALFQRSKIRLMTLMVCAATLQYQGIIIIVGIMAHT